MSKIACLIMTKCTWRVIAVHDLCSCLLPQCEAFRTCRLGFPITTLMHDKGSERQLYLFQSLL